MKTTTVATNLLGRIVEPSPRAPYAWWTKEDKSEKGHCFLATRARIVAVWTEKETGGTNPGTMLLKLAAEALDGEVKGCLREFYADGFRTIEAA